MLEEFIEKVKAKKKGKFKEGEEAKLDDYVIRADSMSKEELGAVFKELAIKSPDTGNPLSDPTEFNLMFES